MKQFRLAALAALLLLPSTLTAYAADGPLVRQAPSATPEVSALLTQGQQIYNSGRLDDALKLFESARKRAAALSDKVGEGIALRRLGNIALDKGNAKQAQAFYDEGRSLHRQAGDKVGETYITYSEGRLQLLTGHSQQALELFQRALSEFRLTGTTAGEALALKMSGDCYTTISGTDQKAIDHYVQALPLFRKLGDKAFESYTLGNMTFVYFKMGDQRKALECAEQELLVDHETGNRLREAISLTNIGKLRNDLGDSLRAKEPLVQAITICRQLGNKATEADATSALGDCDLAMGQLTAAQTFINQALILYRELRNKPGEANALNSLGITNRDTGKVQKALECFHRALALYHEVKMELEETRTLVNIGITYGDTSQYQKALEYYQKALPILRKRGNKDGEAGTLNNIGLAYSDMGMLKEALDYYKQSLPLRLETNDRIGEARSLDNIGNTYRRLRRFEQAKETLDRALVLCRQVGDRIGEARTLDSLGALYAQTRQPQKAASSFARALSMRREMGDLAGSVSTLISLGDLEVAANQLSAAARDYAEAISLNEKFRTNIGRSSESSSASLQSRLPLYYSAMRLQLRLNHQEAAFALAQKTKARNLLDLMASARIDIGKELSQDENAHLRDMRFRADQLNQQMVKEGVQNEVGAKKRYAALKTELKEVESKLETLTDMLYARHPGLAQKRVARTADLADMGRILPEDTALLDYVFVSKDEVRLFVVTTTKGKTALHLYAIKSSAETLSGMTRSFRASCADPRKDYRSLAVKLYQLLVQPAEAAINGKVRLVICPDGPLWDVPFQALLVRTSRVGEDVGRKSSFLAQRFEIAYAYSATGAQACFVSKPYRKRPHGVMLAFANPDFGTSKRFGDLDDLPGQRPLAAPSRPFDAPSRPLEKPSRPIAVASRAFESVSRSFEALSRGGRIAALPGTQREADALKKDFPGATILTGINAQESIAKSEGGKYRYLHFATHGFFNDASPMLSSIVLAQPRPQTSTGSAAITDASHQIDNRKSIIENQEDGFLTAREIFDMDLSAEMVVLSACNTARGVQRSGDGVIGLTWALFVAGCPTQVVSQWSVDDASTATLMERFYANLTQKKMSKGAALRNASLSLFQNRKSKIENRKFTHPYYWAPFVLMGDWR